MLKPFHYPYHLLPCHTTTPHHTKQHNTWHHAEARRVCLSLVLTGLNIGFVVSKMTVNKDPDRILLFGNPFMECHGKAMTPWPVFLSARGRRFEILGFSLRLLSKAIEKISRGPMNVSPFTAQRSGQTTTKRHENHP